VPDYCRSGCPANRSRSSGTEDNRISQRLYSSAVFRRISSRGPPSLGALAGNKRPQKQQTGGDSQKLSALYPLHCILVRSMFSLRQVSQNDLRGRM
jgi:hypothetical protein